MKIGFVRLNDSSLYEKQITVLEPLGLEYLISNVSPVHDFILWDLNAGDVFEGYETCEFICITIPTPLYNQAKKLIAEIHRTCDAKVVVGGSHPSIMPEECISDLKADYVVVGEGESICFDKLTEKITRGDVVYELDSLKHPFRENRNKYKLALDGKNQCVSSMITTRSCPYQCVFCSSKKVFGKTFRSRSVVDVMNEIYALYANGTNTIIFLDDTFTFDRNRTISICNELISNKIDIKWWIDTRVDKVDKALLERMKFAGCSMIVYGIESGNQEILNRIKKNISLDDVRDAVSATKEVGIECKANFMLGHYMETKKQMYDTINFAKKIQATRTSFYQVIPLPGTILFDYVNIKSTEEYDRFKWYGEDIPTICDPSIGSEELKNIQRDAYAQI
jgi:radical SAM superfamily enzyme YgiQ (UPF0313 family)